MAQLTGYSPIFSPSGDFQKLTDTECIVQDLIALLTIKQGTYAFNPSLGSSLSSYIFNISDAITYRNISAIIQQALNTMSNYITLNGQINLSSTSDQKGLVVSFNVTVNQKYNSNISLLVTQNNVTPLVSQTNV